MLILGGVVFNKHTSFYSAIFIKGANFGSAVFKESISFASSIFEYESNFKSVFFEKQVDYGSTIFKKYTNFSNATFKGKASFRHASFLEKVMIKQSNFMNVADFEESKFMKESYFYSTIFGNSTTFQRALFQNNTDFKMVTFKASVIFRSAKFNENASFESTLFNKESNFKDILCKQNLYFREALFSDYLDFNSAVINELNLSKLYTKDNFNLDLSFSQIDVLYYKNTDFKNTTDKETFLILKESAIKKHDQTTALDFYKKEMESHKYDLKVKKDKDYYILLFEDYISDFGTNPIRPIGTLIFTSLIITLFFSFLTNEWSLYFVSAILLMNPTSSLSNISEMIGCKEDISPILESLNFIKNIFFGILIYETIKSFRKFSRKL